jgi:hypothetical protein
MSKGFFILLLALCALLAVCYARPLILVAEELDTNLPNTTNGWSGIAMAFATITKGRLNHRVRVYGTDNINDTLSAAWLAYANGTVIVNIRISSNVNNHYILGDVRVNQTVYSAMLNGDILVVVASKSFPKGAIGGIFYARPNTAVTALDGTQVVPTPSGSTSLGLGYTQVLQPAAGVPLDLIAQTNAVFTDVTFKSRVLYNITDVTTATFNGPANSTSVGPVLVTLTNEPRYASSIVDFQPVTNDFYSPLYGLAYLQVDSTTFPAGDIRGQLYPTLGRTRRAIPNIVNTIFGDTSAPNGLATLRYANQQDNENNPGSFISLTPVLDSTTGNYTYQAFFKFPAAASRRNFNNIRGFTLELNVRQFGDATWNFDYYDATTGIHIPTATFSTPGLWTPGFANYYHPDASTFANIRAQLVVRVTLNSATTSTLWIDLFAVRSFEPTSSTNIVIKPFILETQLLPSTDSA